MRVCVFVCVLACLFACLIDCVVHVFVRLSVRACVVLFIGWLVDRLASWLVCWVIRLFARVPPQQFVVASFFVCVFALRLDPLTPSPNPRQPPYQLYLILSVILDLCSASI